MFFLTMDKVVCPYWVKLFCAEFFHLKTEGHTYDSFITKGQKGRNSALGIWEGRLEVRGRAVMVDVPEATTLMGFAVDSKLTDIVS